MRLIDKQVRMMVDLIVAQVEGDYVATPSTPAQLTRLIGHYSKTIFGIDDLQEQMPSVFDMIYDILVRQFSL